MYRLTHSLYVRGGFAAVALALISALVYASPTALAATTDTSGTISELQHQVEQAGAAYDQAVSAQAQLDKEIARTEEKINEIEQNLPEMRDSCAKAIASSYKMQQNMHGIIEFLLSSSSFNDFLSSLQYIQIMQSKNEEAIASLTQNEDALKQEKNSLDEQREVLEQQKEDAKIALEQAKATRQEAAQKAEAEAKKEAAQENASSGEVINPVDWSSDKTEFVSLWEGRINAYLSGSPLAGHGRTFASAAWDFGVDPRYSPAISAVESSKGAACFAPYNAWGWGSQSWSNWDEAIVCHVSALARYYGSNLTYSAAQKYCPTNPDAWYAQTLKEMNSI